MNLTLIGMPMAGKSTVGKFLAQKLGYAFIDIDKVLEENAGKPLQQILDEAGEEGFLKLEEAAVLSYSSFLQKAVLAPGGSIVYSPVAMEHLKKISTVVFLEVPLEEIKKRIAVGGRGIIGGKEKSLEQLYAERLPLYQKYAEVTVDASGPPTEKNYGACACRPGLILHAVFRRGGVLWRSALSHLIFVKKTYGH